MIVAAEFDPYYRWLGIPPEEQPPDFYRLLGVQRFEPDQNLIESAADRQIVYVRTFALGPNSDVSQRLLSELAWAKTHLLNPVKRAEYDAELRSKFAEQPRAASTLPVPVPPPVRQSGETPLPTDSVSRSATQRTSIWKMGIVAAALLAAVILAVVVTNPTRLLQEPIPPGDPVPSAPSMATEMPEGLMTPDNDQDPLAEDFHTDALAKDLVGHWTFDEEAGTIAANVAGTDDGRLVNGPTWCQGFLGGALAFDGRNDFVSFPERDFGDQFTIAVWINPERVDRCLAIASNDDSGVHKGWGVQIDPRRNGQPKINAITGNPDRRKEERVWVIPDGSAGIIAPDRWQHLAVAFDRAAEVASIWVDGKIVAHAAPIDGGFKSGGPWRLGTFVLGRIDHPFAGVMDDVRLYSRCLTSGEVQLLAQGPSER